MTIQKTAIWKRVVVGAAIAAAGLAVAIQPASAATTDDVPRAASTGPAQQSSCSTTVEEQWIGSTSEYRVRTSCTSIDPGTKVRGVLDAKWYPDAQTEWFSDVNRTHVSDWKISPFAKPTSRIEYARAQ